MVTMPETVTLTQVAKAPLDKVYTLAKQVERFPQWLEYVTAIRILERSDDGRTVVSEWEASVPLLGLKARWVERDEWDDEGHLCRFALQEGDLDRYEGVWQFEPHPDGTLMRLEITYEYRVPIGGSLVQQLVRKVVEQMGQKLLDGIAQVAEKGTSS
jgi:ribosome-associated toxin RatA of RatAB toxin-antitoxin module